MIPSIQGPPPTDTLIGGYNPEGSDLFHKAHYLPGTYIRMYHIVLYLCHEMISNQIFMLFNFTGFTNWEGLRKFCKCFIFAVYMYSTMIIIP